MATAYWISSYLDVTDPEAVRRYADLAGPAIEAGGGRFKARSMADFAFEEGFLQRTVIVEFDSVEIAVSTYRSEAYQKALVALGGGARRDIRIVKAL